MKKPTRFLSDKVFPGGWLSLLVVVALLSSCSSQPVVTGPKNATQGAVYIDVLEQPSEVSRRIVSAFADRSRSELGQWGALRAFRFADKNLGFPSDFQITANSKLDPDLERYSKMSTALRAEDVYLWNPPLQYWHSEYSVNNQPAEFKCDFLLHLESAGNGGSRISALEYLPMVRAGRTFEFGGRHGMGFRDVFVRVQPTHKDRVELLKYIAALGK